MQSHRAYQTAHRTNHVVHVTVPRTFFRYPALPKPNPCYCAAGHLVGHSGLWLEHTAFFALCRPPSWRAIITLAGAGKKEASCRGANEPSGLISQPHRSLITEVFSRGRASPSRRQWGAAFLLQWQTNPAAMSGGSHSI